MDTLQQLVDTRYSVRQYTDKTVDPEKPKFIWLYLLFLVWQENFFRKVPGYNLNSWFAEFKFPAINQAGIIGDARQLQKCINPLKWKSSKVLPALISTGVTLSPSTITKSTSFPVLSRQKKNSWFPVWFNLCFINSIKTRFSKIFPRR